MQTLGTAAISSDEEEATRPGQTRKYNVFEKPWRAEAIGHLYNYLDMVHQVTRNPNGNQPRQRNRLIGNIGRGKPPPQLPIDCYSASFLKNYPELQKRLLNPSRPARVEKLWSDILLQYRNT